MVRAALLPSLLLVVGNNSSRAATWLDVKFPVKMASYARLDVDEVGVACDRVPILFMRSTSPRLEVGTCASGWAAIHLLLVGRGLLVAAFCLSRVAIKGDLHLSCTSSINRARRQAASRSVGVASLFGWPSFVGLEGVGVAWPSCVSVEVPAMCLAGSNLGDQTSPSSPGASTPVTTGCPICGGEPCTGDNRGESIVHWGAVAGGRVSTNEAWTS
jgi:hypothetical protein